MNRSISTHGVILAVLLGLAWMDWTAPPKVDTGDKIVLIQGDAKDLEKVHWKGEKEEVTIERKLDAEGTYYWVTYTKWEEPKKPPTPPAPAADGSTPATPAADGSTPATPAADGSAPAADGSTPAAPAPEPEKVARTQVFKAGDAGDKLIESLSPLLALRELTDVPTDKMVTLGLDAPKETLEVVRSGRSHVLDLGGESYGSKDRYARDRDSGAIYLLDDELLRPLKYARTRLPDRALFSIKTEKIDHATISNGLSSLEIAQKNAEDKDKATWVRASAPDQDAEQLKTWMDKALQLKSTSYVAPDEVPTDLQPRFKLTLKTADGHAETVDFQQSGDKGDWYASSEYTRGLVKLLKGPTTALNDDVGTIVGN